MSLSQFKVALKQFEETEKLGQKEEKSPKDKIFGVTANKLTNKQQRGLCYECGEADHIMKDCPKAIQRNNSQTCRYQKSEHIWKKTFLTQNERQPEASCCQGGKFISLS